MQSGTIPQEAQKVHDILSQLADYYKERTGKLVYHLYSQGYSQQKIGNILGVSREAISVQFPKLKKPNYIKNI